LTVDQSAEKIKGENELDNEVVKDCIMGWVEMDAQPENKNKKQEEIFVEEIQNWVNDYYSEKNGVNMVRIKIMKRALKAKRFKPE
jgi:hypothetical protein